VEQFLSEHEAPGLDGCRQQVQHLGGIAAYFLVEDASEFILVVCYASKMGQWASQA
jgi:hypothetical protein